MPQLPDGIVTFIFTDIEGSTKLWESDSELMWRALGRHNAILDQAIANHQGHHFKTIGDAYQIAFASPSAAVAAAVDAQLALQAESWPETGPLRVRMAIHQGEAHPARGDYLAPCLNRLSRLLSTGFGSQVLLTRVVANQTRTSLPTGVELKDLGRHRLRDLLEPEQVSQLLIPGLPDTFPPLKSLERHPTNLPIQPNDLIGRDQELQQLATLLEDQPTRLITLTGPGGTGKTRLALQLAADHLDDFPDGAFFVDLSPVRDDDLVIPAIAATLGIRESAGNSTFDNLVAYLDGKQLLLLLDNFEQVLPAATEIAQLLARSQTVRIVTTSRAPLNIRGEHVVAIEPLRVLDQLRDPSLSNVRSVPAIQLFVQRAQAAWPSFELTEENASIVAQICAHLDGLPLSIELAAARVRILPLPALLERLGDRFTILTGGARDLPERQRALRATLEWSYALLSDEAQTVFRRVSQFSGGFGILGAEAAANLHAADNYDLLNLVTQLVDHSLIRRVEGLTIDPWFTILGTIREFGQERLHATDEAEDVAIAHARFIMHWAELAGEDRHGPLFDRWLEAIGQDLDNVRQVLAWARDTGRLWIISELSSYLWHYWYLRGFLEEGSRWLDLALANAHNVDQRLRLSLLLGAGTIASARGEYDRAEEILASALRRPVIGLPVSGGPGPSGSALYRSPVDVPAATRIEFLNARAANATMQGDIDRAAFLFRETLELSESIGDTRSIARAMANLGAIEHMHGNMPEAIALYERSLEPFRAIQDTPSLATVLSNLLRIYANDPNQTDRAREYGEESYRLSRLIDDYQGVAYTRLGMALVELTVGDLSAAERQVRKALWIFRRIQDRSGISSALNTLGLLLLENGDLGEASDSLLESFQILTELHELGSIAYCLEVLALVAVAAGNTAEAGDFRRIANQIRADIDVPTPIELASRLSSEDQSVDKNLGAIAPSLVGEPKENVDLDRILEEVVRFHHLLRAN